MDNTDLERIVAMIGLIGGLSIAYGKAMGTQQAAISEAVISAGTIGSRYKRVVNLAIGLVLAILFTAVAALWLGSWEIVPAGVLAGILASTEANKAHDAETMKPEPKPPKTD